MCAKFKLLKNNSTPNPDYLREAMMEAFLFFFLKVYNMQSASLLSEVSLSHLLK